MSLEIKQALEDSNKLLETKMADHEAKIEAKADVTEVKNLTARLDALEVAAARPQMSGKKADADLELKSSFLNTIAGKAATYEQKSVNGELTVPHVIANEIYTTLTAKSKIRGAAKVVTVSTPNFVEVVGTAGAAGWGAAGAARAGTADTVFKQVKPVFGEAYALVEISNANLNDSQFDLGSYLVNAAADEFSKLEGAAFVAGDGDEKPAGIIVNATIPTVKTGVAAAFGANPFDNILSLRYAINAEYAENASFVMNSATLQALAKVKDSQGNYIYTPAVAVGVPDTLFGKQVLIDEAMPNVAANTMPIIFGDISRGYIVADLQTLEVIVDRVTKPGFTKFYFGRRVGGAVRDEKALVGLRVAV